MTNIVKIKKGLNIRLQGEAQKTLKRYYPEMYSVQPENFRILRPRVLVAPGDTVKVGTPVVQDKQNEKLFLTSPVSGEVVEVRRGEKRKLEHIIIHSNGKQDSIQFGTEDISMLERTTIIERLLLSGLWPAIRQRPYHIIASPSDVPDAIFISGFDTAPLAPDMVFIMQQHDQKAFQAGIDVLKKMTSGIIHLNVHPKLGIPEMFLQTKDVRINQFSGPHPVSNVGVQIHHLRPVCKGDVVWFIEPQDVIQIGHLFLEGKLNPRKIFAMAGSEISNPQYVESYFGASISQLIKPELKTENVRVISGNVLTGTSIGKEGFIGFYDTMLSVIPEGDYHEFFGWAMPGFKKFSVSRTFFSWLFPRRKYRLDTNYHGEERAFVLSGQYEEVFPMYILPVQLLKAAIVKDIELMEKLGIYEVAEEDFALCEVICTSKIESQAIIREGIDMMIQEMN